MSQLIAIVIVIAVLVVAAVIIGALLVRRPRLRNLDPEAKARYAGQWRGIETRFIDQPREAVAEADRLAVAVLQERGGRLHDERRVPSDLREARSAASSREGTEGLREAMLHYQAIVDDAVGRDRRAQAERGHPEVT